MADPNALEGKTPANGYQDLFHLNNSNNGVDSTIRTIYSGNGTPTTLQISDDSFSADCNYKIIYRPTFQQATHKALSLTHSGAGSLVVNLQNGPVLNITLEANITSMSVSNIYSDDGIERLIEIIFILIQGGAGGFTVAWPSGTKWAGGAAPTLTVTAGSADIIRLLSVDRGTTWYGFVEEQDLQ